MNFKNCNVNICIEGSLAMQSNIMRRQGIHAEEMKEGFSEEQRSFYGEYFNTLNSYLLGIIKEKTTLKPIEDEVLYSKFSEALLNSNPKCLYKHEPFRYFIYYNLFRLAPVSLRDYFVEVFTKFPPYKRK